MPNSNVTVLPFSHLPTICRIVEPLTLDEFCAADAGAEWDNRSVISGMIILQYPRAIMICCDNLKCTAIRQAGTNIEQFFQEALEAFDEVA